MKRKILFVIVLVFIFLLGVGFFGLGSCIETMQRSGWVPDSSAAEFPNTVGIVLMACAGSGTLALIIYNLKKKKSDDDE